MSVDAHHGDHDPQILEQAAAWRIRLAEAGLESSLELETWLAVDERHERAWEAVERSWDHAALAEAEATTFERAQARRQALRNAKSDGARRWSRVLGARPAIAAAVVACIVVPLAVGWVWRTQQPETFATAQGERRTVALKDGSRVLLDSGTILKVRYTAQGRALELDQGQARFDVAHDTSRPFRVQVGAQSVLATGTNFNIDVLPSRVLVTLLQGKVRVEPRPSQPGATWAPVNMTAGQQLVIAKNADAPRLSQGGVDQATAWGDGLLMFDEEPLSIAVERISRYAKAPVTVEDPATADLRVSGVFKAGDVPGFVDTVTEYLPVRAAADPSGAVHLSRRVGER